MDRGLVPAAPDPARRVRTRPSSWPSSVGALSIALPGFLSRDYDAKSLASLRDRAARTRQNLAALSARLEARAARFAGTRPARGPGRLLHPLPRGRTRPRERGRRPGRRRRLRRGLVRERPRACPTRSRGRASNGSRRRGGSFLVRSKASVYLAVLQPLDGRRAPAGPLHPPGLHPPGPIRPTSANTTPSQPAAGPSFDIDYWDFREDVEGFERFFARHEDEFAGQPRQKNEIRPLFFPLRNEKGRIVATVTLASPSLTSRLTAVREDLRLALFLLLFVACGAGLAFFWSSPGFRDGRDALPGASRGGPARRHEDRPCCPWAGWPGSNPRACSIRPWPASIPGPDLTRSPADILLTVARRSSAWPTAWRSARGARDAERPSRRPAILDRPGPSSRPRPLPPARSSSCGKPSAGSSSTPTCPSCVGTSTPPASPSSSGLFVVPGRRPRRPGRRLQTVPPGPSGPGPSPAWPSRWPRPPGAAGRPRSLRGC
ncbi:MAG: hypothetical protein M0C28_35760 [Candidatus Moduliflexus flocculans]|nr:hypothetical protein [Candidatus Moduliflexus flocculans]